MKTVGGLGYVFSVIPFLNIVAPVLVGIAWIQMGRRTRQPLFKATGMLMVVTFITAMATLAVFFSILFPLALSLAGLGELALSTDVFSTLTMVLPVLWMVLVFAVVVGIMTFILELISHFRAARIYGSKWFSRAAWMRIITIILAVVLVIASGMVTVLTTPTQQEQPFQLFEAAGFMFLTAFIPLIIIGFLGLIFSAIAFFTAPETPPPPPMG